MQKSLLKTARLSRSAVKPMEKLIIIGKIGAPHGVRGEVRIIPLTDFPDRFGATFESDQRNRWSQAATGAGIC